MTKYNYYHVDCGHFPAQIKLCFDNGEFQKILADHDIKVKATALDEGVAETHYITDGREGIIIMIFDLEECDDSEAALAGVIAHEATHCVCRVFEHIGEEPDEIGEESRAYLTEHIVKQITQAVIVEKERRVRETSREKTKRRGKKDKGSELQVDLNSNGSSGSPDNLQGKDISGGTQDGNGQIVGKTKDSV
jgi:hypothetical protein